MNIEKQKTLVQENFNLIQENIALRKLNVTVLTDIGRILGIHSFSVGGLDLILKKIAELKESNNRLVYQNELADNALTAIAKQLGFESFVDDKVMIEIERMKEEEMRKQNQFDANTPCPHEVIYLRGEGSVRAFGESLNEAIECLGGLGALDENIFDSPSDQKSFKNLFNPDIESIVFGDEDFGFVINRGKAISDIV